MCWSRARHEWNLIWFKFHFSSNWLGSLFLFRWVRLKSKIFARKILNEPKEKLQIQSNAAWVAQDSHLEISKRKSEKSFCFSSRKKKIIIKSKEDDKKNIHRIICYRERL